MKNRTPLGAKVGHRIDLLVRIFATEVAEWFGPVTRVEFVCHRFLFTVDVSFVRFSGIGVSLSHRPQIFPDIWICGPPPTFPRQPAYGVEKRELALLKLVEQNVFQ